MKSLQEIQGVSVSLTFMPTSIQNVATKQEYSFFLFPRRWTTGHSECSHQCAAHCGSKSAKNSSCLVWYPTFLIEVSVNV